LNESIHDLPQNSGTRLSLKIFVDSAAVDIIIHVKANAWYDRGASDPRNLPEIP
jgi:hypothetical protein